MNSPYQITTTQNMPPATMGPPTMLAMPPAPEPGSSIDLASIVEAFRRRWWLIAGAALLGALLAALYLLRTDKIYASQATVEVPQGKLRMLNIEALNPEDLGNLEVLKTMEQSIGSSSLMLRVAEELELRKDPAFQPGSGGSYSDAQLAGVMAGMISVDLRRGTRLIDIVVRDTDPERVQRIAAAMVDEFNVWEVEQGKLLATGASSSLEAEAEKLLNRLQETEAELVAFRERHGTGAMEGKEGLIDEKAKSLAAELATTKSDRLRLEADLQQIGGVGAIDPAAALSLPSVSALPEITSLRTKLSDKEAEFAMVQKRYKRLHPVYAEVSGQLEGLRSALSREAMRAAATLESTRSALVSKETRIESDIAAVRTEQLELERVLVPYKSMLREVEADRDLYASVRQRQKEAAATGAVERASIALKEAALVPADPVWPRPKLILALGLFAGLSMGSGLVLAGAVFDRSFKTRAQAERALGMPLLASLPRNADAGASEEAYRTLRTSLTFVGKGAHARTLVFASSRRGEGAVRCAVNCARAFARQGQRTLLIDADLRSPEVDMMLLGRRVGSGLAHYLKGDGQAGQLVKPTPEANLFLLGAGAETPNAGELLASPRLGILLEESKQWFHKVVITSSALGEVSEGLLAARHADSVCLVVEAGSTPRAAVFRSCQLLSMAGAPPVGFVLTGAKTGERREPHRREPVNDREAVIQKAT